MAGVLPILLLALLHPQGVQAGGGTCTLSGRVVNALTGEPLRKARLHLTPYSEGSQDNDSNRPGYVESSTTDGSFQFTAIEPGSYQLSGDRIGFLETTYGAQKRHQAGTILTLRAGETIANISLALQPEGVISGRVVDDDGDPIAGAIVGLSVQNWTEGQPKYRMSNGTMANDRGEFRLGNLEPGKYVLSVSKVDRQMDEIRSDGKPVVNYAATFYPEANNIQSATPITIQAGQQIEGIEVRMHGLQTFHVRGRIAGSLPDGVDLTHAVVMLSPEDDNVWFNGFHPLTHGDSFDVSGVAPGKYRLTLIAFGSGRQRELGSESVTVDSTDVDGVVVSVRPPLTVRGQVRLLGAPPSGAKPWSPPELGITLSVRQRRSFERSRAGHSKPNADGTFTIDNVAAKVYDLNVSSAPDGAYLESVRLNGEERLHKPLDLSQGASSQLLIAFRYGAAELTAKVQVPATQASDESHMHAPPPMLALVPEPLPEDDSGASVDSAGQSGSFTFKNLAPGKYEAFAFEAIERGQLRNPAILQAIATKGRHVELKPGDRKEVQLNVISAADMQKVLAKMGFDAE